ncbi:hypothetical protein ACFPRL_32910 [Pseudoclavibacter helvolus]
MGVGGDCGELGVPSTGSPYLVAPARASSLVGLKWSAAMFSDCPQPECDDFYAANVSGP